jgi:AraC family transcriptional regulator
LAKIAVELERAVARRTINGSGADLSARVLARGDGWIVEDVICTSGQRDRSFEERHSSFAIAMVVAGTFQYRSARGRELMTPGSVLLGNPGQCFECGHEHAAGDRCISFRFEPEYFEDREFRMLRVPPLRELSPLFARASAGVLGADVCWEELVVDLAGRVARLGCDPDRVHEAPSSAVARVTRVVRRIESDPSAEHSLKSLAADARLSAYHFLRTFEQLTGLTPHRYILRARLRDAAMRLVAEPGRILQMALDCGFGDVSNFNRAFRAEFGVSPRAYRSNRSVS